MMLSESVTGRITDFYYRYTASEELTNLIDITLLQAMWDTEEQISEDELVQLAIEIIQEVTKPDSID